MSVATTPKAPEMPLAHAVLAFGLVLATILVGGHLVPALQSWPFFLLVPLVVYLLVVGAVAPLRGSLNWMRSGRLDFATWGVVAVVILASSSALWIWHELATPDLSRIVRELPQGGLPTMILAGIVFSCVNALLEEVFFRGVLFDSLRTSYGVIAAVILQAVVFGTFHLHGIPSGYVGVALATIYGLMQGGLRVYTGGLAACWVAHVAADATIFLLLLRHVA